MCRRKRCPNACFPLGCYTKKHNYEHCIQCRMEWVKSQHSQSTTMAAVMLWPSNANVQTLQSNTFTFTCTQRSTGNKKRTEYHGIWWSMRMVPTGCDVKSTMMKWFYESKWVSLWRLQAGWRLEWIYECECVLYDLSRFDGLWVETMDDRGTVCRQLQRIHTRK